MNKLDAYLARYFKNAEQLAGMCQLPVGELSELIRDRLIPAPSYVVSQSSTVRSYVFGEMPAAGAACGEYFHPANEVWVDIARRTIAEVGHQQAHDTLKRRFVGNLHAALADLNVTTWRLRDGFADDGSILEEGLQIRLESMWEHFLQGTYGLCVANPCSEAAIAWKEVLQEKLVALSDNGVKAHYSDAEARTLLELIGDYAAAAMPFSPIEYPLSSRKRLVEDLSTRISGMLPEVSPRTK